MKLPKKDCYSFAELAERWSCKVDDLRHFVALKLIVPAVYVNQILKPVYFESWETEEDGEKCFHSESRIAELGRRIDGLFYLHGSRVGPSEIKFHFLADSRDKPNYLSYTVDGVNDITKSCLFRVASLDFLDQDKNIPESLIVVTSEEVAHFESQFMESADANIFESSRKATSPNSEKAYLNIIGALCDIYWREKYPHEPKLVQARIIEALIPAYEDFYGISERNLKTHLPKAIKAIRNE